MHLAFVKHSANWNSQPCFGDLTLLFHKLSTTGIKYDITVWNDPNINWAQYTHIILTFQIDYVCHTEEFLQWIDQMEQNKVFTIWNSPGIIKWNYNKKYLLELEGKDVRIPATVFLEQSIDKNNVADAILDGFKKYESTISEIVVKNAVGAAGKSVWRSKLVKEPDGSSTIDSSAIDRLYQQLISSEGRFGILVQEFLPVILNEGEWSLVYFNKQFSHAVIKRPRSRKNGCSGGGNVDGDEFRIQARYGGYVEIVADEKVPQLLLNFGEKVLSTLSEDMLHARVDILMGEDGKPYLLELEVLDMLLYISEPIYAERYLQAIMAL